MLVGHYLDSLRKQQNSKGENTSGSTNKTKLSFSQIQLITFKIKDCKTP